MEVVLSGAQHREAGESRVREMTNQAHKDVFGDRRSLLKGFNPRNQKRTGRILRRCVFVRKRVFYNVPGHGRTEPAVLAARLS